MIVVPVCLFVVATAAWLLPLVFGRAFEAAVGLTRIMVWQLVWLPYIWLPGLLLALGRARLVAAISLIDGCAYLLLLILLTPTWAATGAACATVLRFIGWTGMAAFTYKRVVEAGVPHG
jgi:O-antigen/teichoic acid export membrane protein